MQVGYAKETHHGVGLLEHDVLGIRDLKNIRVI
jgi:hypothetical protein